MLRRIALVAAFFVCVSTVGAAPYYTNRAKRAAVLWASPNVPVQYYVSSETIGRFSKDQVIALLTEVVGIWENEHSPTLPQLRLGGGQEVWDGTYNTLPNRTRSIHVVFDQNNAIARHYSVSAEKTFGLTKVRPTQDGSGIDSAVIALTPAGIADKTLDDLREYLLHELGHALGLGHVLVHSGQELRSGSYAPHVPVMFPYIYKGAGRRSLRLSERAWFAFLYSRAVTPSMNIGVVRGKLVDVNNAGVSGVNVVAVRRSAEALDDDARVSCLSGYTGEPGEYALPLPPGDYQIFVESIPEAHELPQGMRPFVNLSDIGPQLIAPPSPPQFLPHSPNVQKHEPEMLTRAGEIVAGELRNLIAGETRNVTLRLR